MAEFPVFFDALLTSVASFLWMDATKWITASVLLIAVIAVVRRLLRL